ncbi:hypothetical protein PPYR_01812 [Photinus pyralis]|uniref:Uncharacterized protein n=1 Tax=Photinus pyralis TaxID=7054 RepID=A0A5N4B5G1_PHOPY|nr:uncharacterized protein LOC116159814 [Photinus pyralis]KAB0804842.1 hypothetical protein PPYR_01812 [Photinus pyralis]
MPKKEFMGFKPIIIQRNLRKKPQKLRKRKVIKMLAVMEAQQIAGPSSGTDTSGTAPDCPPPHAQEFLSSGRTGRRNALPDILGEHALVTSSELPGRLQSLSTSEPGQGTSKSEASTSSSTYTVP